MAKKKKHGRSTTKASVAAERAGKWAESEQRYWEFVEGTDDLVTRVDGDGRFVYVNHAAETVLGVKPDACVGLSAFDFIHTEDRTRTQEWFYRCLRERVSSATFENRQMSRTGEVRQMLWTCSFHYDDFGRVTGVNSLARDITERKQAEGQLAIFQRFVEASGQCFGMTDLDGRIIYGNPALLCLCGVENLGEIQGESFKSFHPAEEREMLEQEVLPTIMREGQWVGELTLLSRTGKSTSVISNHFLVRDEKGKPCRLAAVMTDISERLQASEALKSESRLLRKLLDLQERERKLVAYEIHDGFLQTTVGAKLMLDSALPELGSQPPSAVDQLRTVGDLLQKSIAEGRRMIAELRPMIIDEAGIVTAIQHLISGEFLQSLIERRVLIHIEFGPAGDHAERNHLSHRTRGTDQCEAAQSV